MRKLFLVRALLIAVPPLFSQPGTVDDRIKDVAGLDPKLAKAYFEEIKRAVGQHDKNALSSMVAYPTMVNLGHAKNRWVRNRAQFEQHFEEIINQRVTQAVASQSYEDLFVNYKGIMLGNGEIWFSAIKGPSGHFDQFRIIKINN